VANYRWHKIASTYELAHHFPTDKGLKYIEVIGKSICIVNWESNYYAIDDKCSHAGGSLSMGKCDESGNVICPIHRIGFRCKDGGPAGGKGYFVNSYPLENREDGLYIGFKKKWFEF